MAFLSPAGDMERLPMAISYGADSVYLAGQLYGMDSFAGNFSRDDCDPGTTRQTPCPNSWNI